jgi:tight adherence protein C
VTAFILAVVLGAPLGLGLLLMWNSLTASMGPKTGRRIAPYVSDVSADAHVTAIATGGAIRQRRTLRRRLDSVSQRLAERGRGAAALEAILLRAGRTDSASEWTARRLMSALVGAAAGLSLGCVYSASVVSIAPVLGMLALGGIVGWWVPLWLLKRQERARALDVEAEMSAGLELLGLRLAAGEDLTSALVRVARLGSGPFTSVIRDAVARVEVGVPVARAMTESAQIAGVPALMRAMEHITATLERGTPLVDVLSAQVSDVREETKRRLIESAGKNEVLMLIPLVFLILPVTIAFAVFPGIIAINAGI